MIKHFHFSLRAFLLLNRISHCYNSYGKLNGRSQLLIDLWFDLFRLKEKRTESGVESILQTWMFRIQFICILYRQKKAHFNLIWRTSWSPRMAKKTIKNFYCHLLLFFTCFASSRPFQSWLWKKECRCMSVYLFMHTSHTTIIPAAKHASYCDIAHTQYLISTAIKEQTPHGMVGSKFECICCDSWCAIVQILSWIFFLFFAKLNVQFISDEFDNIIEVEE